MEVLNKGKKEKKEITKRMTRKKRRRGERQTRGQRDTERGRGGREKEI